MARGGNGSDVSFNRFLRLVTGGNEPRQKIAMTTPVFISGDETNATMAFVMPANMKTGEVSKRSDGNVTVRELASGRLARLRDRGSRSAKNEAESLERLRAWMKAEGLKAGGSEHQGHGKGRLNTS
jgi:hypothetical protein